MVLSDKDPVMFMIYAQPDVDCTLYEDFYWTFCEQKKKPKGVSFYLLWADNKGDGHEHQAVPHVEHQANLNQQFYQNFLLKFRLLVNLNKEDEDDAEPPEFHCGEDCAKDVALHIFSVVVVALLFLFVCFCFIWYDLLCCFCWMLPERMRRDPRGCSEWSHLTKLIVQFNLSNSTI